jgi:hypothetical protein
MDPTVLWRPGPSIYSLYPVNIFPFPGIREEGPGYRIRTVGHSPFILGGPMDFPSRLIPLFLGTLLFLCATPSLAQVPVKVFPNPCLGDSVQVEFTLPAPGRARVLVYNEAGDLVASLREVLPSGLRRTTVNFHHFRRGLYLCQVVMELNNGRVLRTGTVKFTVVR